MHNHRIMQLQSESLAIKYLNHINLTNFSHDKKFNAILQHLYRNYETLLRKKYSESKYQLFL